MKEPQEERRCSLKMAIKWFLVAAITGLLLGWIGSVLACGGGAYLRYHVGITMVHGASVTYQEEQQLAGVVSLGWREPVWVNAAGRLWFGAEIAHDSWIFRGAPFNNKDEVSIERLNTGLEWRFK